MDFHQWINHGVEQGWCTFPVCDTHEGTPLTPEEEMDWASGGDPCVFVMRLWQEGDL